MSTRIISFSSVVAAALLISAPGISFAHGGGGGGGGHGGGGGGGHGGGGGGGHFGGGGGGHFGGGGGNFGGGGHFGGMGNHFGGMGGGHFGGGTFGGGQFNGGHVGGFNSGAMHGGFNSGAMRSSHIGGVNGGIRGNAGIGGFNRGGSGNIGSRGMIGGRSIGSSSFAARHSVGGGHSTLGQRTGGSNAFAAHHSGGFGRGLGQRSGIAAGNSFAGRHSITLANHSRIGTGFGNRYGLGGSGFGNRGFGWGRYGFGRGFGWGGLGWGRYGYGRGLYGWGRRFGYGFGYPFFGFGWPGLFSSLWYGGYGGYGGYGYGGYGGYGYGYGGSGGYGCGYPSYSYSNYGYPGYGYDYTDNSNLYPVSTTLVGTDPTVTAQVPDTGVIDNSTTPAVGGFSEQGEAAFRSGDFKGAEYAWRHAVVDDPQNPVLVMMLSQSLFANGKFDEAAGATQTAMQQLPKDQWGVVVTNYKDLYGSMQSYTDQLRALEKAAKEKPDSPALRFLLGFHYAYLGFPQQGVAQLDKAIKLAPQDEMAKQLRTQLQTKLPTPAVVSPAQ